MRVRHWITLTTIGCAFAGGAVRAGAEQAADAAQKVREALGGDALQQIKAITVKGAFRRELGQRQIEGELTLIIEPPGRMHRSEEMELMGGASMERLSGLSGDTSWEDTQNRGGMGGGIQMQMMMRGPNGEQPDAEQMAQIRTRRLKAELNRWRLAFLSSSDAPLTAAGVAEAPEGTADVLELKDERGRPVRLFADQETGMPLMITYQDVRPRMMLGGPGRRGGGGRGQARDPEEARRRMEAGRARMRTEGPPPPSTVTLYLADYKEVQGVKLPHRITESVDGKPVMEWTIEKFEINPELQVGLFEKQ